MENARAMARSSQAGKVKRMLGADNSSASVMKSEGVDGTPVTTGLSGSDRGGVAVSGRTSKARMDKPSRARGGGVRKGGIQDAGLRAAHAEANKYVPGTPDHDAAMDNVRRERDRVNAASPSGPYRSKEGDVFSDGSPRRARGGAVNSKKKGTNINVIVAPQGGGQGGADPLSAAMGAKLGALSGGPGGPGAGGPPPMPPQGGMPPGAPAGMPPGAGAPPPPPRPPMAGQPVPMRAAGGRVARASGGMTAGAGSGLGREEKAGLRAAGGRVDMPASEKPKGTSLKAQVAKIKSPSDPKPRKAKPDDGQAGFGFKRGGKTAAC